MAGKRTPPDWTRTGTVEGYAEYLRKQSDALCVVVIRPFNSVISADPKLAPKDLGERLAEEFPGLIIKHREALEQGKRSARIEHERISE